MAQQLTIRQQIQVYLDEINNVRQRIRQATDALDVLEVEHQQKREALKTYIANLSPALAEELFKTWYA
jgi:predicted  nucleic acid-binding Zn-ribbon protein